MRHRHVLSMEFRLEYACPQLHMVKTTNIKPPRRSIVASQSVSRPPKRVFESYVESPRAYTSRACTG